MMCADMVEVSWNDAAGKRRWTVALLEDIAHSGACLQLETPLPTGATVEWSSPHKKFRGIVCYCVYREIGYFAGIEFDRSSKWSKSTYRPGHLFDPRVMMEQQTAPDTVELCSSESIEVRVTLAGSPLKNRGSLVRSPRV
jgi:hypothetical protein